MILYIDAATGASGDKLLAALLQIAEELELYSLERLNSALGALIPGLAVSQERVVVDYMRARRIAVSAPDEQPRRTWRDISSILLGIDDESVRTRAYSTFLRIARAEALVHMTPIDDVHFHEIGAVDTIGDIVGVALLMDALSPDAIVCSPIATGSGTVLIEHGEVPVPAPATAEMLRGVPTEVGAVEAELTTPTGAAILTEYVTDWGALPPMTIDAVGYGAGTLTFPGVANVIRILAGQAPAPDDDALHVEGLVELTANIDHIAPEAVAYVVGLLIERGALDAFTAPVTMKKGRLALELTALARPEQADALAALIHRETGTLGVRRRYVERTALGRTVVELPSEWGPIRFKIARMDEVRLVRPEHDDVARIARERDLPYRAVRDRLIALGEDELLGR